MSTSVHTTESGDISHIASLHVRDLSGFSLTFPGPIFLHRLYHRDALDRQATQLALSNVRFLGRRPPQDMASYLALADAQFLHLKRDPAYAITIPSKTYAYLAAGRPIIAAAEGEVADLVLELGAGVVCPPEDPAALAHTIVDLYGRPKGDRARMGRAAREASVTQFSRQAIAIRYEELFRAASAGTPQESHHNATA